MDNGREIRSLQRQVSDLKRRADQRPVLVTSSRPSEQLLLVIVGGNTLETGQNGVVYEATVASVPSAYDPTVTSSFIDGIGRATLYRNGVADDDYVLVVNSNDGSFRNAAFQNDPFATSGAVSIPVDGGGFVSAYTLGT